MLTANRWFSSGLTALAVTVIGVRPADARFYSQYTAHNFQFDQMIPSGGSPVQLTTGHSYDLSLQITAINHPLDPPKFSYDYTGIDDPRNLIELTFLNLKDPINGVFASAFTNSADIPAFVHVDGFGKPTKWTFDLGLDRSFEIAIDADAKKFDSASFISGNQTRFIDHINIADFAKIDVNYAPEPSVSMGLALSALAGVMAKRKRSAKN